MVGGQLRDVTGGETNDQHPATPVDRPDRLVAVVAADGIEDDIRAPPVRQCLDLVAQFVALRIVHQVIGAARPAGGQFLVRAGGGNDPRAPGLAGLDSRQTGAARCAEHQQGLTRLQATTVLQRMMNGAIGQAEGGGGVEVHRLGQGKDPVGRTDDKLCQTPDPGMHGDPLANRQTGHPRTKRVDGACGFHPRCERRFTTVLVLALWHQQVGEVEGHGVHPHPDLSRTRFRLRQFADLQILDGPDLLADDRPHPVLP